MAVSTVLTVRRNVTLTSHIKATRLTTYMSGLVAFEKSRGVPYRPGPGQVVKFVAEAL